MRRSSRRKRRTTPVNHDRWLITYADLITLLMIFFIVMYAMSRVDIQKYETLGQALQQQFREGDSVLDNGTGIMGGLDRGKYRTPSPSETPKPSESKEEKEKELQDLLKTIRQYVKQNHLEKEVFIEDTSKGISIRLSDRFLFDLGMADLKKPALPILNRLSSLFGQLDATISIQGHTDNIPIQAGAAFQDNWGLSAGRALSVLRYFVDEKKIEESKFEVAGYADIHPIAPNDTDSNRQKNRRVEIVVLRQ